MTAQILVVDDEPHFELIVRKAFRRQIRAEEYNFIFALNGVQALQKIEEHPEIEMVLSDINMPEMDGLTLLGKLNELYPLLRTVVITAYADMSNIRTAMNGGAFDFLIKPIGLEDLKKTIEKTLRQVRQLRELERIRREKENARRELVDHLQKMDKLKDDFLANISHELNTPLNGIIGITESLSDGAAGPLSLGVRDNLDMVISSGKRLSSLVHDLLDFSKLKNSDLKLNLKPLQISSVAQAVLGLCRPLLAGKELTLHNEISENLPLVLADENRLEQILYNLVGNAIKFTEKGHVKATAQVHGDLVEIAITDTGPGIPEEYHESIFNSFEQLESSETRKYSGTGLGLAITRQLVQLHGGVIGIQSEVGAGSCFSFTLPVCLDQDARVADPEMEERRILTWEMDDSAPQPVASDLVESERKCRILVADDEPVNLRVVSNQFALQGYEVVTCLNGPEALETLEREQFDLFLLDLMMPGMSGYEVCRKVREKWSLFNLPILILTAKTSPAISSKAWLQAPMIIWRNPLIKESYWQGPIPC